MGYKVTEEIVNITGTPVTTISEFVNLMKADIPLDEWAKYYRAKGIEINKTAEAILEVENIISNMDGIQTANFDIDSQTLTRSIVWPSEVVYNNYVDIRSQFVSNSRYSRTIISTEVV